MYEDFTFIPNTPKKKKKENSFLGIRNKVYLALIFSNKILDMCWDRLRFTICATV